MVFYSFCYSDKWDCFLNFPFLKSFFFNLFILFLVELGLCCCSQAFSSCSVRVSHCEGFFCCGTWALGTRASVVAAHRLSSYGLQFRSCDSRVLECKLSTCGTQAYLIHVMWNLPGPGSNACPLFGRQILTQYTTREVTRFLFLIFH